MDKIQNINKKSIAYYLVIATIIVFVFSESIYQGPLHDFSKLVDGMKIKYIIMAVSATAFLVLIITRKKKLFKNGVFQNESKLYLIAIGTLAIITIVYQIFNGFRSFVIAEFCYLLIPLIFVILVVSVDYTNITRILDTSFYVLLIAFIVGNIGVLNPSTITSINFSESFSPFENGSSMIFVFFELYFLIRYGRRNGKSLVCLILTILTLKRISVIMAIFFFIFVPMLKDKKVPRWVFVLTIVVFCTTPFLLEIFYSSTFASYFFASFGLDFNDFTMDRFTRTAYVLGHLGQIKYGYGSVTYFLTNNYGKTEVANRSLHSDLLRIYLECSFIGVFIYNICYFLSVKKNIISFLLMVTIFLQMVFNHPLGAGTVGNWIIIYLMIVYFNYRNEVFFYKEGRVKRKHFKFGKIVI